VEACKTVRRDSGGNLSRWKAIRDEISDDVKLLDPRSIIFLEIENLPEPRVRMFGLKNVCSRRNDKRLLLSTRESMSGNT